MRRGSLPELRANYPLKVLGLVRARVIPTPVPRRDQRFLPSSLQAVWPARAASSSQTNCPNARDALIVQFAQSTIALTCRIRSSVGQERGQAWREHEKSEAPS